MEECGAPKESDVEGTELGVILSNLDGQVYACVYVVPGMELNKHPLFCRGIGGEFIYII